MNKKKHKNLHFLTHASRDAGDWPFFQAMQQPGVSSKVFGSSVSLKYPHRIWLYLIGWPKLLLSGLQLANASIAAMENDTIVTAHDHILLLAYKMRRFFSLKARKCGQQLVLHGFIFTPRSSTLLNQIRENYFRWLLRNVALVICHSRHEIPIIGKLVDEHHTKIASVHYGIGEGGAIKSWHQKFLALKEDDIAKPNYLVVTAGRSSRDYETLVDAINLLPDNIHCDIICDNVITAPHRLEGARVKIHRSLYGNDYTDKLISADIIAVPLSEFDISAGQMVLLHALAAAKPVIITETATSTEYVEETDLIKRVPPKNAQAIASAITDLCAQFPLSFKKRIRQRQLFEDQFSDVAHGRAVFAAFKKYLFETRS